MPQIHPTAIVDPKAQLDDDSKVGPFCVIGPNVTIGSGSILQSHIVVSGWTTIGKRCQIHPFAVIGGEPQDRKYRNEKTELTIEDNVIIREYVTVHRGTARDRGKTIIGPRTMLMAYTHVAHDCKVGSDVVMANGSTLAGHVILGDFAVLGGFAAVGQMLRVGESAMLAAGSMVEQDVPPFCTVSGDRAKVRTVNVIGIRRRGFSNQTIAEIKKAYRTLFRSELSLNQAIEEVRKTSNGSSEVLRLVEFLEESRRGVCR